MGRDSVLENGFAVFQISPRDDARNLDPSRPDHNITAIFQESKHIIILVTQFFDMGRNLSGKKGVGNLVLVSSQSGQQIVLTKDAQMAAVNVSDSPTPVPC